MFAYFILIPLAALVILNLPLRTLMIKLALPLAAALSLAQAAITGCALLGIGKLNLQGVSSAFGFNLAADRLSLLVLFCNGLVILTSVLVARGFTHHGEQRFNFVSLLLIAQSGINGIVLVRDLFSLYVFLEVASIASFILISFHRDHNAFEGAFKYLVLSMAASVAMLTSIALLFLVVGDSSFESIKLAVGSSANPVFVLISMAVFLCGLFIKAGLVPFHGWLPDAYTAAPASVSIFLAGISTKALGVYTLIRIMISILGVHPALQEVIFFVGGISIVLGAVAALTQTDFKRMLAYSSISQVGYIVLGASCMTPLGIAGAAFHFFNHAVLKSLLFVNAAAVEKQAKSLDMPSLGGLAERMPVTGITSMVASLSVAGVPPLSGFWSKLLIVVALWMSGHFVYAWIAIMVSLLTLTYMLSMQRQVFFGKINETFKLIQEAGWEMTLPAIVLAAITIAAGLASPFLLCRLITR